MKFLVFLIFCISNTVWSLDAAELLQNKLNAMHSMTASFSQKVKLKKRLLSHSSGDMAMQRPGRFRWEIKTPLEQLVMADGKKMWIYDKDLEQVTVKKQNKGLGGTAALFLSGYNDTLTKDFDVSLKKRAEATIFNLKAKSEKANFQKLRLRFNQEDLVGLELLDQLGQTTVVEFKKIQLNLKLPAELFQFKTPKGVDVVYQ